MAGLFDHINLRVTDLKKSTIFYSAVLSPLGLQVLLADDEVVGFGQKNWDFGIEVSSEPVPPMHLAFSATDVEAVEQFYAVSIAAGGRDNGAPGWRPEYGATYYAAFVLDPDGHNIEMVFRGIDP